MYAALAYIILYVSQQHDHGYNAHAMTLVERRLDAEAKTHRIFPESRCYPTEALATGAGGGESNGSQKGQASFQANAHQLTKASALEDSLGGSLPRARRCFSSSPVATVQGNSCSLDSSVWNSCEHCPCQ